MAGVRLEVRDTTGNAVKRGGGFALDILVTNDGESVDGVVEASEGDTARTFSLEPEKAEQAVHLPGGSRKRVSLVFPQSAQSMYAYSGRQCDLVVRVRDGRGLELARTTARVQRLGESDLAFVVLSPERSGFDYLSGYRKVLCPTLQSYQNPVISVSYPLLEGLPEHWSAYTCADMVVLSRPARLQLRSFQQRALMDWVASGGTLLVITGTDPGELQGSLLAETLPRATGTSSLAGPGSTHAEREAFKDVSTVRSLDVALPVGPPWRVLRALGGRPLLLSRPWGRGVMVFSAVDMAASTTMSDQGLRDWWGAIMKAQREREARKLDLQLWNSQVLAYPPEITPPSMGFLSFFLLAWVIVVGPLNFFVLRRLDRMPWMYVTVPVLALLFTGGSFFMSLSAKGRQTIVRQVAVVEAVEGMPMASVWNCASVFAVRNARYDLVSNGATTLVGEMTGHQMPSSPGYAAVSISPDSLAMRGVLIPMWTLRRFVTQTMKPLPGKLELRVKGDGSRFTGTIENRSGLVLSRCVLYDRGVLSVPFDLGPGANPVGSGSGGLAARKVAPADLVGQMREVLRSRQGDSNDLVEDAEALLVGGGGGKGLVDGIRRYSDRGPVLVGWARDSLVEMSLEEGNCRRQSATLVVVHGP